MSERAKKASSGSKAGWGAEGARVGERSCGGQEGEGAKDVNVPRTLRRKRPRARMKKTIAVGGGGVVSGVEDICRRRGSWAPAEKVNQGIGRQRRVKTSAEVGETAEGVETATREANIIARS